MKIDLKEVGCGQIWLRIGTNSDLVLNLRDP
jgi:hypothetical protein